MKVYELTVRVTVVSMFDSAPDMETRILNDTQTGAEALVEKIVDGVGIRTGALAAKVEGFTLVPTPPSGERPTAPAPATTDALVAALRDARPYLVAASEKMYDGTNGHGIRQEAKRRIAAIDAALASIAPAGAEAQQDAPAIQPEQETK